MEELRAELASVFMAAELGIPHDPTNHAAYVGSWIKALREDKNEIFRAAHEASTATDFVLSLDREVSRAKALDPANSVAAGSPQSPEEFRENDARDEIGTSRANGEIAADVAQRQEPAGIGSAGINDKVSGTERHASPTALGRKARESDRSVASAGELATSFAAAKQITTTELGESARTFRAQTESGRYNGRIVGETAHHVVQRLSPQSAVAHVKNLLAHLPHAGDNVAIAYSNDHAQVRDLRERVNAQELGR
jgi:hypothetical protein